MNESVETCGQVEAVDDVKFGVLRGTLMIKDRPQCPGDDDSAGEVTLSGRERIGGRSTLQR